MNLYRKALLEYIRAVKGGGELSEEAQERLIARHAELKEIGDGAGVRSIERLMIMKVRKERIVELWGRGELMRN